jgi:methyltransferase (TIGR00027 family)
MTRRTAFVDNEVASAIGRHTPQVVILGAGYDGRALRFADGATRWFEVDLPSTQADKRRRLAALGIATEHVTYVSFDLMTGDLAAALDEEGHDATAPSLFVCEALFPYLTLEAGAALCRTLRARAPDRSLLVSTFPVLPEAVGPRTRVLRAVTDQALRVIGEPERCEFLSQDPEKLMVVTGWRPARSERVPDSWLGQGSHLLALAAEPDSAARP